MAVRKGDLLQGTLDLLVLKVLGAGPNHGYGIATRLHQLSDDVLRVEEGSLYPALYRMEEQGLHAGAHGAPAPRLRLSGAVTRVLRALEQET